MMENNEKTECLRRRFGRILAAEFGTLAPGTRLASVRNLQKRLNCSRTTIDAVLDNLEVRGIIARVPRRGIFAAGSRIQTIYFPIPCPPEVHRFNPCQLEYARRAASASGIDLVPVWVSRANNEDDIDLEHLRKSIPEGASIIVSAAWYHGIFDFLNQRRCNVAFMDNEAEWIHTVAEKIADWHIFRQHYKEKVGAAVACLASQGCRRPLFLHCFGHEDAPAWAGFRSGLRKLGLAYTAKLVLGVSESPVSINSMLKAFDRLGYCYDGVVAFQPCRAWAAHRMLRNHDDPTKRTLPIVCFGSDLTAQKLPPGVTGFYDDKASAMMEAVRVLASGERGPSRHLIAFVRIDGA